MNVFFIFVFEFFILFSSSKQGKIYSPYRILEVHPLSSQETIKKSHKLLSVKYHPDKNKNKEENKQIYVEIQNALENIKKSRESNSQLDYINQFYICIEDFLDYYDVEDLNYRSYITYFIQFLTLAIIAIFIRLLKRFLRKIGILKPLEIPNPDISPENKTSENVSESKNMNDSKDKIDDNKKEN